MSFEAAAFHSEKTALNASSVPVSRHSKNVRFHWSGLAGDDLLMVGVGAAGTCFSPSCGRVRAYCLVSPEAQKIFAEGNFEYPLCAGVQPHPVIAAWGEFKADKVSLAEVGRNSGEALKLMDRAGWK